MVYAEDIPLANRKTFIFRKDLVKKRHENRIDRRREAGIRPSA